MLSPKAASSSLLSESSGVVDLLSLTGTHPHTHASFTLFEERGLERADKCYLRTRAVGTVQKVTLNAASQAGQFSCLVPGFGLILSFLSQLGHLISTL